MLMELTLTRSLKLLLLTVLVIGSLALQLGKASPGELRVPQDYGTIQEAIDATRPGDTIPVEPGTYVENLKITEWELTIRGTDSDASKGIVQPRFPDEPVALIRERDVRLSNLTLTGGRRRPGRRLPRGAALPGEAGGGMSNDEGS